MAGDFKPTVVSGEAVLSDPLVIGKPAFQEPCTCNAAYLPHYHTADGVKEV